MLLSLSRKNIYCIFVVISLYYKHIKQYFQNKSLLRSRICILSFRKRIIWRKLWIRIALLSTVLHISHFMLHVTPPQLDGCIHIGYIKKLFLKIYFFKFHFVLMNVKFAFQPHGLTEDTWTFVIWYELYSLLVKAKKVKALWAFKHYFIFMIK